MTNKKSKFSNAWEQYKKDYPNRRTLSIQVNEKKQQIWFLDYHDNVSVTVCLTQDKYYIEQIPDDITLL
tara:strand:- start:109 stop:315 length:207 start_codon:yes stop_codon:yes gene_type:complete